MNALTFLKLKKRLGLLIDRNEDNALTLLGYMINEAYLDICKKLRFDMLARTEYLQLIAPYTTGTVAVSSQGTTVTGTGTAFTDAMVGQKIVLNGQAYEIYSVATGTSLTISRPYEDSSNLTGATTAIYYDAYTLPYGWEYPRLIYAKNPKDEWVLKKMTKEKFDRYFPNPTQTGNPYIISPAGYSLDRLPKASGTLALQAGTDTTTAVLTGAATIDDYYNDWYLVNTTRDDVSRGTDYTGSTQTLTVSPAITSQVATDAVYLEKKLSMVSLYPLPDSAQALLIRGYGLPTKMVNDYEIPLVIPEAYHRTIYLRAASHSSLILDDSRKREVDRDYEQDIMELASEYNMLEDEGFYKESIDEPIRKGILHPFNTPIEE